MYLSSIVNDSMNFNTKLKIVHGIGLKYFLLCSEDSSRATEVLESSSSVVTRTVVTKTVVSETTNEGTVTQESTTVQQSVVSSGDGDATSGGDGGTGATGGSGKWNFISHHFPFPNLMFFLTVSLFSVILTYLQSVVFLLSSQFTFVFS